MDSNDDPPDDYISRDSFLIGGTSKCIIDPRVIQEHYNLQSPCGKADTWVKEHRQNLRN